MTFFGNLSNVNSLECISIKNQECKVRLEIVNINSNSNTSIFSLMSRTNETKFIKWQETCKCICRLHGIICNSKQRQDESKCRCECKELIYKGTCNKEFIWNPSNCECECDKNCDIDEYLDYENCKCRKNQLIN